MKPMYRYRAKIARVIDGDTFVCLVDLGFGVAITVTIRLRGVDTPELNTPEGLIARDFVINLLDVNHAAIVLETYKDQQTFARWVADVYFGDKSLAEILRQAGHVKQEDR